MQCWRSFAVLCGAPGVAATGKAGAHGWNGTAAMNDHDSVEGGRPETQGLSENATVYGYHSIGGTGPSSTDGRSKVSHEGGLTEIRAHGNYVSMFSARGATSNRGLAILDASDFVCAGSKVDGLSSPLSSAQIPGRRLGTEQTDDAEVVPTVLTDDAPEGDSYLAIYLRTPSNDLSITAAALSATVRRDDTAITHLEFDRTLDPGLGYHYGTHSKRTPAPATGPSSRPRRCRRSPDTRAMSGRSSRWRPSPSRCKTSPDPLRFESNRPVLG